MQRALLKIAALLSVMGVGGVVTYKVHDQLQLAQQDGAANPGDFKPLDGDDAAIPHDADTQFLTGADPASDAAADQLSNPFSSPPDDQSEPGGEPPQAIAVRDTSIPAWDSPPVESADAAGFPFPALDDPAATAPASDDNPFATASRDDTATASGAPLDRNAATTSDDSAGPFGIATADGEAQAEDVRLAAADLDPAVPSTASDDHAADPFGLPEQSAEPEPGSSQPVESLTFGGPGLDSEMILPDPGDSLGPADDNAAGDPAAATLEFDAAAADSPPGQAADEPAPSPLLATDESPSASAEPATAESAFDPFGGGISAGAHPAGTGEVPAADTASPLLDLGAPTLAAEPPANSELPADAAASSPALGHDLNSATSGAPPAHASEPNRFPAIEDDDGPPLRTAIRERNLAPLRPAENEQLFEIRPNPAPATDPNAPRPEFVGDATLDDNAPAGSQQPELTIQKLAPPHATVGDPLVYAIKIKNVGQSTAHDVIVEDRIPRGSNLQGSIPRAEQLSDKRLIWQLGHMAPGAEETIRIKVVPTEPGEIGSVATVRFVAEVAATTRITTPKLTMDVQGPSEVAVGEPAVFHFRIANVGDGEARNVYIRNLLPEGFEHPGGRDIEYDVGVLKPGETRDVDLAVKAVAEGPHELRALLNTGATQRAESATAVNVIRSRLLIQRQGPKRRFVGRPADYTTLVTNRSSSPLKGIQVVEQLPVGLELSAIPEGGHFDAQRRTITWQIKELAPGAQAALKTSVIAQEPNLLESVVRASDKAGNRAQLTSQLEVAGFASLALDLNHNGRPVGVGEQVALQLKVKNRGTGAAEHVEARFEIPPHLEFVNADGPVDFRKDGDKVLFAALDELPANKEETFKIILTAVEPGNTAVTAQLTTADGAQPLQHTEQVIVEGDIP